MSRAPRGRGRGRGGRPESRPRNTSKLFVGNMPETVRRADLQALFDKYGKVVECDIVKDFAFVHYVTVEEAQEAVDNLHNTDFQGSKIRVELSHSHVRTKPGMGDKNECYRCGNTGHWSKDCPKAPPDRRGMSFDRSRPDPYSRNSQDPYARDPAMVARDPYARDPYSRSAYVSRDPYAQDPYSRDPYSRDPYLRERLSALSDRYSRSSLRYDPYARQLAVRELPLRETFKDPYVRPPPDYYSKPSLAVNSDPYSRLDPYSRASLLPR